ncbi:glycosyltransferase family 2 protein [Hyphomonas sp.]|uniref:glycosyltransferase family 2 protein n=1 Tax=Hyphomonas sp. TaxID=87 RepID=UPI0025BA1F81|nr:glycosyltransferase family 2 protein [Hyphomonas sp.]
MSAPTVSIVMPAWKAEAFIAHAVESVLAQTLTDWELIVVDDCSPDATGAAALAAAKGDPRVRVVRAPENGGVARARNLGMQHATGTWIAVLDSDDAYEPTRLEALVAVAEREKLDILTDDMILVPFDTMYTDGPAYLGAGSAALIPVDLPAWLRANHVDSNAPLYGYLKPIFRRAFIAAHKAEYIADLRVAEDCWFVADLLAYGARLAVHPQPLYRYAVRPASLSRTRSTQNVYSLQRPVYDPFIARHRGRLSPADQRALRAHETALRDAEAYEDFIIKARQKKFSAALGALAARPQSARFLSRPVAARLKRLAQKFGYKPALRVG